MNAKSVQYPRKLRFFFFLFFDFVIKSSTVRGQRSATAFNVQLIMYSIVRSEFSMYWKENRKIPWKKYPGPKKNYGLDNHNSRVYMYQYYYYYTLHNTTHDNNYLHVETMIH